MKIKKYICIVLLLLIAQQTMIFSQDTKKDKDKPTGVSRHGPVGIEMGLSGGYLAFLGLGMTVSKRYRISNKLQMSTGISSAYRLKIPKAVGDLFWNDLDDTVNWDAFVGLDQRLYVFRELYVGFLGGYSWWSIDNIPHQQTESVLLGLSSGYMIKFAKVLYIDPQILVIGNVPMKTFEENNARLRYVTAMPSIIMGLYF